MKPLRVFTLKTCDTCRRATRWLREHDVAFVEVPIRETPPSVAELREALDAAGGEVRRLCNTSGREYREQQLGTKLDTMPVDAVLTLLSKNGSLVKRPFVVGDHVALTGFDAETWAAALDR